MEQRDLFGEPAQPPRPCPRAATAGRRHDEADVLQPQLPFDTDPGYCSLYQWTDTEIAQLCEGLLYSAIHQLCDRRTVADTREELWAWVDSDAWCPFSFRVCVQILERGIDPDELRVAIRRLSDRAFREGWALPEDLAKLVP